MRGSWKYTRAGILAVLLAGAPALAQTRLLFGRVTLEDGTPPPRVVNVERYCGLGYGTREAATDRQGRFTMRYLLEDPLASNAAGLSMSRLVFMPGMSPCFLRATLKGYVSTTFDLNRLTAASDPHLPPLVLQPRVATMLVDREQVPGRARQAFDRGMKASQAGRWADAERAFRSAVAAAPRFAPAWNLLGGALENQHNLPAAAEAFQHAIAADPKLLPSYAMLVRVAVAQRQWEEALRATAVLIRADTEHAWPEARYHDALARYNLKDYPGAAASARELLQLDPRHRFPRAEYILGLALAARRDLDGARRHLNAYLILEPKAADAAWVRAYLRNPAALSLEQAPPVLSPADARMGPAGEVWIPGGMRALAAMSGIAARYGYHDFFAQYCRALILHTTPGNLDSMAGLLNGLATYFQVVSELERAGQRRGDSTLVTLSLAPANRRKETVHLLALLGWKLAGDAVEVGDGPADGPRQRIPAALGIDEIAMRRALEQGLAFHFEILSENARLSGGQAWAGLTRGNPALAGGLAEAFADDLRLARAYAALDAMGDDTAAALVAGIGFRAAANTYSEVLSRYGDAFLLAGSVAALPGGPPAESAWTQLAGAAPSDPPAFFRGLLQRDAGRTLPFYAAVAGAGTSVQRYLTAAPGRLLRYYRWFRETPQAAAALRELPLDPGGAPHFPGGRAAWGAPGDDDALVLARLPVLAAVARLERQRGAPLDADSARLLAGHWTEWEPLAPYFAAFNALSAADFQALSAFADAARAMDVPARNARLGQWYSLLEILALARRAGALDAPHAAEAFRGACLALRARDASTQTRQLVAALTGGGAGWNAAIRDRLLRLDERRRERFDRVLESQRAPALETARGDDRLAAALSAIVYAAWLDPDTLPLSEDPGFLRRHRFAVPGRLFAAASLEHSNLPPGSRFRGGFAGFAEAARQLPPAGAAVEPAAGAADRATRPASPAPRQLEPQPRTESVFRADARLVEVYATITDPRGRYVDNLPQARFQVLEEGAPQRVTAFESQSSAVSVALLLDTTGSMERALPALKNAAIKLIGELRGLDQVAVYSFAERVHLAQPFTSDKQAAERAVLRTAASGETALYDALARVARDISGRSGKKVIVVFTDGEDNKSVLTAESAIRRAKNTGAPVYTLAQGGALNNAALLRGLEGISQATGGMAFAIREPAAIRAVLERVAQDLMHGYLLVFPPPPIDGREWRRIDVRLTNGGEYHVRAREGYYPE